MEQIVYIDVFFLINLSMDLLCFFITSKLLSHPPSMVRIVIASVLGAIYACGTLLLIEDGLVGLAADILACLLMSVVAVKKKGYWSDTLNYAVVYTAVSVVVGGIMTVLFSLFNRMDIPEMFNGEDISDGASVWLLAIFAAISGMITLVGGKTWKKNSSRRRGKIEISYGHARIVMRAICDSGNLLTEPISGRPCIIVDRKKVEPILPLGVRRMLRNGGVDGITKNDMVRVRIVPTRTVNGSGLLYAVQFDEIRLNMGNGWHSVDAYLALSELSVGKEKIEALVPAVLAADAP